MELEVLPFNEVFEDYTSKFKKIPKSHYSEKGKYPIIDQSKEFIAGYTDNYESVNNINYPLIVFGDHTKSFKYINFPITLGADGAKALIPKSNKFDVKYLFYVLLNLKLPDSGYSRHFKYLKKSKIVIPRNIENQKRIAQVLTDCENLIAQRKESIALLDDLVKSTFLEMFGDPLKNKKDCEVLALKEITNKIGSGSTPRGGKSSYKKEGISLIRSLNIDNNSFKYLNLAFIDKTQAKKLNNVKILSKDVLLNITGASVTRVTVVPDDVLPARVNQHVSILRPNLDRVNPHYLSFLLASKNFKAYLIKIATLGGATREALNKTQLEELMIPRADISLQNKFGEIVEKTHNIKNLYKEHLSELENLYARLSQDAFKGDLDLSKVTIKKE